MTQTLVKETTTIQTHSSIATDSAELLRSLVGEDATAGFESDARFQGSNPGAEGSSEHVTRQMRDSDDLADSEEEMRESGELDEEEEDEEDEDEEDEEADEDSDEEAEAAEENNRDVIVDKALRM